MRRRAFTLIEILLCAALLGILLYMCSQVLITTLRTKQILEDQYAKEKVKAVGWHILYQDLANAVGIYFLDGTAWAGSGAAAPAEQTEEQKKSASEALAKFQRSSTGDLLLEFKPDAGEEPFLCVAVAQGRQRSGRKDLGFRMVRYFLLDSPEEGGGQMILRTEEQWTPNQKKEAIADKGQEELGASDLLAKHRRYAVLEGLTEVKLAVYNGEEWVDEWDSSKSKSLPLALRVQYHEVGDADKAKEEGVEDELKSRSIPIPISDLVVKEPLEKEL